MLRRIPLIIIVLYTGLACCRSKSSGPSFSEEAPTNAPVYPNLSVAGADTLIRKLAESKQYDSINVFLRNWIDEKTISDHLADAVHVTVTAFGSMPVSSVYQKKAALTLYKKKEIIEKDSVALQSFYFLFTDKYAFNFLIDTYDPQYIEIGEYFIALQNSHPQLSKVALLGFKENLGIGYNVAGDLKKASSYYREVLESDLVDENADYIGASAPNYCIALMEARLYDSVIRFTGRLMKTYSFSRYHLSSLYTKRAEAFLRKGNPEDALAEIKKVTSLLPSLSGEELLKKTMESTSLLSEVQYATGKYSECIALCNRSLETAVHYIGRYRDRVIGKILLQKGAAYRQLQQPDSAATYFHQALYTVTDIDSVKTGMLPAAKDIYAENTLMDALDSLAAVWDDQYALSGNSRFVKQALEARKLAFATEKKLLEAFSYDEAMQDMLQQGKKRSERALNNCYILWQKEKKSNWVQEALLLNENSKAIVLLHSVKRNNVLKAVPAIDSAVQPLNNIRYRIIMLERNLAAVTETGTRDSIRKELEKGNREFLELESKLNMQYPALKRTGTDTSLLQFDHLHRELFTKKTCLLQYFVAGTGVYIVWLDDNKNSGMEFIPAGVLLTANDFIQQCRDPRGLFEKDRKAFFELATSCTKAILPLQLITAIREDRCNNLVVIPDGIFSILPFEALSVDKDEFLVKKVTVSTASSINTLLLNNTANTQTGGMSVFTPFSKHGFHDRARLPFTAAEAKAITEAHPKAVLFDDTASGIRNFNHALQYNNIIHIATHAGLDDKDEPRIYFSDSILYMPELYASGTNASLVVLSGCETGLGKLDPNEGPLSLSRAFYYAGAGNVINSLWQIDDAATAGIFKDFYEKYTVGNAGDALRKAKLEYLNDHPGASSAPYYWAGLVHTGLDKEKDESSSSRWIIYGLLIVLLPVIGLLYLRNRRVKQQ